MLCLSFYLPSFCLPSSFNSISPKFLQSSTVVCVLLLLSSESEFVLVVEMHFLSPWCDPSWLTGRKTSSVSLIYPTPFPFRCIPHCHCHHPPAASTKDLIKNTSPLHLFGSVIQSLFINCSFFGFIWSTANYHVHLKTMGWLLRRKRRSF